MVIQLKQYNEKYLEQLLTFHLPPEQLKFTSLPIDRLNELKEGQYPIVILKDDDVVGFFLLNSHQRVQEYTNNQKAMLLTALSINQSEQGKGYAKEAMLQLKSFVKKKFTICNEIILAVNHKNLAAQQLYLSVGFVDEGRKKMGPIGEQYIMQLSI
ncbi:GNAT family N-acetyltransferase [Bacillus carboniphilus]